VANSSHFVKIDGQSARRLGFALGAGRKFCAPTLVKFFGAGQRIISNGDGNADCQRNHLQRCLAQVLTIRGVQKNFDGFLTSARSIKRVEVAKSSEKVVRELRHTPSILPIA
jgi:hypothetical protein